MVKLENCDCKIFSDTLEEEAIEQVTALANHPAFDGAKIRIMPDGHAGKGCVIGFTANLGDKVVPNLVGVDIGCLDKDTEVLTKDGWIKISNYNNEKILVYDLYTDKSYFDYPLTYIKTPCEEFYYLHTTKGLDMMISDDHTMMYWRGYHRTTREIVLQPAKQFVEHHNSLGRGIAGGIKTTFDFSNDELSVYDNGINKTLHLTDDEIRVWAMFSADGRVRGEHAAKENANGVTASRANFHFKKERKIKRCQELLKSCNFSYDVRLSKNGTTYIDAYIPKYMTKSLKPFYNASKHQLYVLACESLMWDGHKHRPECDYYSKDFYSTTIKDNADVIQFAFASNNIRCGIFLPKLTKDLVEKNYSQPYSVIVTKNIFVGFAPEPFEKVPSTDGYKYCFTTNTGAFVIRRNNCIQISHNCGMLFSPIFKDNLTKQDFEQLDSVIDLVVPSGRDTHTRRNKEATSIIEELRCKKKLKNWDRLQKSLGTLGGGNHFIEIDEDKTTGEYYLVIHTGSRNVGKQVCEYYQKKAIDKLKGKDILNAKRQELIKTLKESGQQQLISKKLKELEDSYKPAVDIPDDLCYLTGEDAEDYLHDAHVCQKFANRNREVIARAIFKKMGWYWNPENNFTTLHNYIDQSDGVNIIRKGAVSAKKGEKILIPLNMRDGSLICIGKGNDDWNQSAPHGAGRRMSRNKAFETLDMEEYTDIMKDIYSTCVTKSTLDESPMAYKDMNEIIDNIRDTVEIEARIQPIYNFKAS